MLHHPQQPLPPLIEQLLAPESQLAIDLQCQHFLRQLALSFVPERLVLVVSLCPSTDRLLIAFAFIAFELADLAVPASKLIVVLQKPASSSFFEELSCQ